MREEVAQPSQPRRVPGGRVRDVGDALFGLKALADGCAMDLDANGRQRAGRLADIVRSLLDQI